MVVNTSTILLCLESEGDSMSRDLNVEVYETKVRATSNNDVVANQLREELNAQKTFLVNLMSSPGSGKTTTLVRTINALKDRYKIGVMEADVDSDVDAKTIAETGAKVIQLHTGGACHMDADMTHRGLVKMGFEGLDLVFLENVGNLVCPAEFDIGANLSLMILSVPEGDDKPLKYPLMFTVSDVVLINKIDVCPIFDFDFEACKERVTKLNGESVMIPVSSKTGENFDAWIDELVKRIEDWRATL